MEISSIINILINNNSLNTNQVANLMATSKDINSITNIALKELIHDDNPVRRLHYYHIALHAEKVTYATNKKNELIIHNIDK